uniref:ADAMTS cysteine-rich domain-containing protein n=1 Tax=Eptatretus burgeri TaxID=7764 RepID=A0A8C4QI00_EPTBU
MSGSGGSEAWHGHVMASTLSRATHGALWSPCSSSLLKETFLTERDSCLLSPQRNPSLSLPPRPAGWTYSARKQCQLSFGPAWRVCPNTPPCRKLWCFGIPQGNHPDSHWVSVCRTRHASWAEGTHCGTARRCLEGVCLRHMGSRALLPVDGNWGSWSTFGTCSRSCGGGVQFSERLCDSPYPQHGGSYCLGIHTHYRSCKLSPCNNTNGMTFREEQCAMFNGQRPRGETRIPLEVHWIPQEQLPGHRACSLTCRAIGTRYYFVFRKKVGHSNWL